MSSSNNYIRNMSFKFAPEEVRTLIASHDTKIAGQVTHRISE